MKYPSGRQTTCKHWVFALSRSSDLPSGGVRKASGLAGAVIAIALNAMNTEPQESPEEVEPWPERPPRRTAAPIPRACPPPTGHCFIACPAHNRDLTAAP